MEPGFFLKLAESTDDVFAYYVLPGKDYNDTPTTRQSLSCDVWSVVETYLLPWCIGAIEKITSLNYLIQRVMIFLVKKNS